MGLVEDSRSHIGPEEGLQNAILASLFLGEAHSD